MLTAANRLLASITDSRVEANEIGQRLVGTVRIVLFDQCASNPEARLSRAICRFNDVAPEVEIELSLEPPTVIEAKLLSGELDIGIITRHRHSSSLEHHLRYGENMFLYCAREHPFFDIAACKLSFESIRKSSYAGISVNSLNLQAGQTLKLGRSTKVQSEHALTILILSGR